MKHGSMRSLVTGMLIGGTAATMFGIMNWQTEKKWNQQIHRSGRWLSKKTDELMRKL